jgi:hypothetical protein
MRIQISSIYVVGHRTVDKSEGQLSASLGLDPTEKSDFESSPLGQKPSASE